ncbi:MAG: acyl-CoA dehydrogenase [Deltaproteobacteria bacterium]|nr:acyl-CoA dehydrogenase [Deltaproteobacteria bacterium]MBT4642820.1 acyl-CoA dehydrogenase [Deltaproteobacteria bacterium]MBT6499321.1 acyl-CoA dehydrogenase [Deltaproteobacteria bacterium]
MAKDLYFTKEHDQVRRAVRDFIKKDINPYVDEWEEKGTTPLQEIFKKMGDLGFLGIRYDPKYGGLGLDYWYELVFLEELGHIDCGGVPMAIGVQTNMATPAIDQFGSEYLKETYLVPAIAGDMVGSIAVTEPDAGSDVAALKTFAKREGDEYVINGSKTFITNGTQADFLTLLARTSDEPGYHCFGLFVVPTNLPGFVVSKKLDKLGMRSSDTAELFFDNLRVPAANLIGEEGEGFIYQMQQFQHERFFTLPLAYIGMRNTIEMTMEYLKKRIVNGKPLLAKQVLKHRLVQWLTEAEALKQLTYHIVRMKEAGQDASKEISMGKLLAGQLSGKVTDGCLQMFGGAGFMNEMRISRDFRDSRLTAIGGGANEVMSDVIAKLEGM